MASRFGPAKPRGVTWNGAGGCVIVSQSRQENFSRTVWITFHWRGITSSVSVMSSPSFDSCAEPQQGQLSGAAITTRSRGRCSGNGLRDGRLRSNDLTVCVRRRGLLGRQLVLGRRRLELLELKLHLLEQPRLALRARAVELAPQLLDLELQMGDQRFAARQIRLRIGRFGRASPRARPRASQACRALGEDHRMRGGKIGGERFRCAVTSKMESHPSRSSKQNRHPTEVGRQVSCGCRQSMPDSR